MRRENGELVLDRTAPDLEAFCDLAIERAVEFASCPAHAGPIAATRDALIERGAVAPPVGLSRPEAIRWIVAQVRSRWGYDLNVSDAERPVGERLDVRMCVVYKALRESILAPSWTSAHRG